MVLRPFYTRLRLRLNNARSRRGRRALSHWRNMTSQTIGSGKGDRRANAGGNLGKKQRGYASWKRQKKEDSQRPEGRLRSRDPSEIGFRTLSPLLQHLLKLQPSGHLAGVKLLTGANRRLWWISLPLLTTVPRRKALRVETRSWLRVDSLRVAPPRRGEQLRQMRGLEERLNQCRLLPLHRLGQLRIKDSIRPYWP